MANKKNKDELNRPFWLKFFTSILNFINNNKFQDFEYIVKEQIKILEELKNNRKLDYNISDIQLDQIIKSCINFDNNLFYLKKDLSLKYNDFIPILNYQLYIKQLEQLLILFEEKDIKGIKNILKRYIEMENIIESHYNL